MSIFVAKYVLTALVRTYSASVIFRFLLLKFYNIRYWWARYRYSECSICTWSLLVRYFGTHFTHPVDAHSAHYIRPRYWDAYYDEYNAITAATSITVGIFANLLWSAVAVWSDEL